MKTELDEVGEVNGKSLLHLQCHFGQDTLSWARRGADVTGVDFAPEAISLAKSLSTELNLKADFVCSDIYELPSNLEGEFDIIFTSYGVLAWLPDLAKWGEIVAHYLKPGGMFYIVEFHPLTTMIDESGVRFEFPYFHSEKAIKYDTEGSYAYEEKGILHDSYEWPFGLGDVVTALTLPGLKIEFLHEFPYNNYRFDPYTKEIAPGRFVHKGIKQKLPHMFSIRATKHE